MSNSMVQINLESVTSVIALEEILARPYPEDVAYAKKIEGSILVLGAGGKMGPSLVARIVRAREAAGKQYHVHAVSRFSDNAQREYLEKIGANTITTDLLDESSLETLPDCPNVIYMAGTKFGASDNQDFTWAMNAYVPGRVADRFRNSRIVAFSTGNVYPFVSPETGGCREVDPVGPVGEYAQSCLGRERVLQYFSRNHSIPVCILRLNYAVELRYGVLCDIATRILNSQPVNLSMGWVNLIWQGDANSVCFRSLEHCQTPADILNLTGPEVLSVRSLAERLGDKLGVAPQFEGEEGDSALLNNAARCHERFGIPRVSLETMLAGVAAWIKSGGVMLGKPTKFEVRNGQF